MTVKMKQLSLAILLGLANPAYAEQTKHRFEIPPQALGAALQALASQSGAQMLYSEPLMAGKQSKGINGYYTTREAAEKLLEGSGLTPKVAESGTVTITPADSSNNDATKLPAVKVVGNSIYDVKDPYNEDYVLPNATSGTKTDTPIMETPLNVQVISKQVLKDQQVIRLDQALQNVSGVTTGNSLGSVGLGGTSKQSLYAVLQTVLSSATASASKTERLLARWPMSKVSRCSKDRRRSCMDWSNRAAWLT